MNKSHIGHDAEIGDRRGSRPTSMIGGHAWVGEDANIGMASSIHQNRAIGAGAMIGMHATVVDDVGPFQLVKGNPARASGVNVVGMTRLGFTEADVEALRVTTKPWCSAGDLRSRSSPPGTERGHAGLLTRH